MSENYRQTMIFIDGGYFREGFKRVLGRELGEKNDDFSILQRQLSKYIIIKSIRGEIIRTYYYDAIVDSSDLKYDEQKAYFSQIQQCRFLDVKLGRLIKTDEGYRQKGVDILLTTDMLTKAFLGHYEFAGFVGGDDDFVDLIKAVKEQAGNRIFGFYFPSSTSIRLLNEFDVSINLEYNLKKWGFRM